MSGQLTFGNWLRQRRTELGVTRDELSERLGFSLDTLRKLESGERRPSGQIAHLLADYFRIPADEREAFIAFARTGGTTTPVLGQSPIQALPSTPSDAAAPWRHLYVHQTNLPAVLTPLIGREHEVAAAREQILNPKTRLLTLTGAPGIGKTRLGLQLASDLVGHFEDGVFLVDLAPIVDPELVLATIAYTLGLNEDSNRSLEDALVERVRERRMVLLLDNFEQVLDAAPALVRLMLASPWLKIIVTSREPLHVRGERRYPVPALQTPQPAQIVHREQFVEFPAVSLFVERAQAVEPDFTLNESNALAVAEICKRLGGLPLSIELIAARIKLFSPDVLLARLGQLGNLELLTGGARDLPARHRSLRGAIAWSYGLLSHLEQAHFRRLGVFVGGFDLESAAFIFNAADGPSVDPAEAIASLLDKSLLSIIDERAADLSHGARFSMLETIREYALEQLREEGEAYETQRLQAIFYMKLAERLEPELKGPDQVKWLARLEREFPNIRAALEWSSEFDAEMTVRIMVALSRFWYIRGHYAEGGVWLEKVLAMGSQVPVVVRANALHMASGFVIYQGDIEQGKAYLEESVTLARQAEDKGLLTDVQGQLGYMLLEQGNFARAKALFEASLVLDRELGNEYGICWLLTALGEVARCEEDYVQARAYYEEGLLLARKAGNKYNIAHLVGNLGWVALVEGDYERAGSLFRESLALSREVEYGLGVVGSLAAFAALAAALKQPDRAARLSGIVERLTLTPGSQIDATDRRAYERYIALARSQLGEEEFEKARKAGYALTVEEAIKYALE